MFHFNFILVLSWVNFWGVTLVDGLVNLTIIFFEILLITLKQKEKEKQILYMKVYYMQKKTVVH